jgi:hypothetical protein
MIVALITFSLEVSKVWDKGSLAIPSHFNLLYFFFYVSCLIASLSFFTVLIHMQLSDSCQILFLGLYGNFYSLR